MSLASQVGLAVRRARQSQQLTTRELAASVGMARATLEKLEAGDPGVSLANAQKVMDYLQVTLSDCVLAATPAQAERKRVSRTLAYRSVLVSSNTPSQTVPTKQQMLATFSKANREREYDAVRGVKALLRGKPTPTSKVSGTEAYYADVAALLATLAPSQAPLKQQLVEVAKAHHGVVARAVRYFSPKRLASMARSQALFSRATSTEKETR